MATHSSILAWRIPWTEEPGGLQSIGSQRVGYDSGTQHARMHKIQSQLKLNDVITILKGLGKKIKALFKKGMKSRGMVETGN